MVSAQRLAGLADSSNAGHQWKRSKWHSLVQYSQWPAGDLDIQRINFCPWRSVRDVRPRVGGPTTSQPRDRPAVDRVKCPTTGESFRFYEMDKRHYQKNDGDAAKTTLSRWRRVTHSLRIVFKLENFPFVVLIVLARCHFFPGYGSSGIKSREQERSCHFVKRAKDHPWWRLGVRFGICRRVENIGNRTLHDLHFGNTLAASSRMAVFTIFYWNLYPTFIAWMPWNARFLCLSFVLFGIAFSLATFSHPNRCS
jgi:hypothetical protein